MIDPNSINFVVLILTISGLLVILSEKLNLNLMALFAIVGLGLGFVTSETFNIGSPTAIEMLSAGIGFSLVILGSQFNINKLKPIFIGPVSVVLTGFILLAASFIFLPLAGLADFELIFVALLIPISSVALVMSIMSQHNQHLNPVGESTRHWIWSQYLGLLFVFPVLAQLGDIRAQDQVPATIAVSLAFFAMVLFLSKYLIPHVLLPKLDEGSIVESTAILISLFSGLLFIGELTSIPSAITAFGIGMTGYEVIKVLNIKQIMNSLSKVSTGFSVILIAVMIELSDLNFGLLIVLAVLLGIKVILTSGLNVWFGFDLIDSIGSGLSQAQLGEVTFLIAVIALNLGWITHPETVNSIGSMVIVGILLTPFLYVNVDWIHNSIESTIRKTAPNLHRGLFINSNRKSIVIRKG